MTTVQDILREKSSDVKTIAAEATVFSAVHQMLANNIGSLIVLRDGEPRGIVTERDYLRKVALAGRSSNTTTVEQIATMSLVAVGTHTSIDACMALMTVQRIRHLPVIERGYLRGLVSIGDIVKHKLGEQNETVQQLTEYIHGVYISHWAAQTT